MQQVEMGALVMTLRPIRSITVQHHMGRAVQSLCLSLVQQYDAALSDQLHNTSPVKPYTASGLLHMGSTHMVRGVVSRGDQAWIRLVGLRADVVHALTESIQKPPILKLGERSGLETPPQVWQEGDTVYADLDHQPWAVEACTWDANDHRWAGRTTYLHLAAAHQNAAPPHELRLQFATPTAFSSADLNIPLPDPMRVFESLYQRWQDLNTLPQGMELPDSLLEFVRYFVPLMAYQARTVSLEMKSSEVGFCADEVKFDVKEKISINNSLRKNHPDKVELLESFNAHRDEWARALALLSDFAFFCGVGSKTTTGMGMVRSLQRDG